MNLWVIVNKHIIDNKKNCYSPTWIAVLVESGLPGTSKVGFLFTCLCIPCMFMHTLLRSIPSFKAFLNFRKDVSNFILDGRLFQIFGCKGITLWVPNLLVFIRLTMMSFYLTFEFSLGVNIFFMWRGLISFRVLNISVANVLNLERMKLLMIASFSGFHMHF